MGTLYYGSPPEAFDVDDRTLAHVEIVALAKLRRNEGFALSLELPGGGRSTVWIGTNIPLRFEFGTTRHEINRLWLEDLVDSSNTPAGMRLLPESGAGGGEVAASAPAASGSSAPKVAAGQKA